MIIPADQYAEIIDVLPVLCVDIVARTPDGRYLLVKRLNDPRRDQWWVIGGRVHKGETLEAAAARKLLEEAGVAATAFTAVGYYEEVTPVNPFGRQREYHAVSVVFEALIPDTRAITLDSQSGDWTFAEALPADFQIRRFGELTAGATNGVN